MRGFHCIADASPVSLVHRVPPGCMHAVKEGKDAVQKASKNYFWLSAGDVEKLVLFPLEGASSIV